MDWTDHGIVLASRRHGETSAIATLLTRDHGRHAGLVRGGSGKRMRAVLQPGNTVAAHWRARLAEHLGTYTLELERAEAAALLDDPTRLAGLSAACALVETALPVALWLGLGGSLPEWSWLLMPLLAGLLVLTTVNRVRGARRDGRAALAPVKARDFILACSAEAPAAVSLPDALAERVGPPT